jgi:hypothetical protein
MKQETHVSLAGMGEIRNAYTILVGKAQAKRSFTKRRCRWTYNIIMCLRGKVCESVEWTKLIARNGGLL